MDPARKETPRSLAAELELFQFSTPAMIARSNSAEVAYRFIGDADCIAQNIAYGNGVADSFRFWRKL